MKLIRQIALEFREGTSDKVYEVDLCEVGPERFVVNFRFGKRGSKLQEGSKTPLPVGRAEADRVYDKLVSEKTTKGYHERGATTVTPVAAVEETAQPKVEELADPRHQRITAILAAGGKDGWTPDPDRLIFRAGELRVRDAAGWVVRLLDKAGDRRAWNIARALLRCGDPATGPSAIALAADPKRPDWVRTLARHAAAELATPDDRRVLLDGLATEIASQVAALAAGRFQTIAADLADRPDLLDDLYMVASDGPLRLQLLELLRALPVVGPSFAGVRRVYKAAEARGDGEPWGLLAARFEREKCGGVPPNVRRSYHRANVHSPGTRKYLRRRSWRTLRRLGEARMAAEYCAMAAGLLLGYSDETKPAPKRRYRGAPAFAWHVGQWALGQILFSGASGWRSDQMRLRGFRARSAEGREERFPELWDAHPEVLADLLDRSRLLEVHAFAATALRANRPAWGKIPVRTLVGWFSSPYAETARFAAEVAITRYDPNDPDLELVLALVSCPHADARATAERWVKANPGVFLASTAFVTGIVLAPVVETRRFALELLGGASLRPDHARLVVDAVIDRASRTPHDDTGSDAILRDAAAILTAGFARELAVVPLERVAELLRHPVAGVAELGAKILLGHQVRAADLPDDLLAAAMTSIHAPVRGIGVRLYGELPDAVLAERFRVLVHLIVNPHADVRYAVAPIVVRLAGSNPGFAKVALAALIPLLAAEGVEGMHRDVVRLLRTELASVLPLVDAGNVFRLLRASETVVQELGGDLLRTNVPPGSLTPFQLGILASSDVAAVRATAFLMLDHRVEAVRAAPDSVLPLLDARWDESRERAFAYVEEKVGFAALTAEVVLAVCDSVRPDVQAFGRKLVAARFDHADGAKYLVRLAQHPSAAMQGFAASWLEEHAAGNPALIERLVPFFVSVLARPNQGRVAKVRVLQFMRTQLADEACARILVPLLGELVLTAASSHRAQCIEMLAIAGRTHPGVPNPLVRVVPEVRSASGGGRGAV